jgi:hypothetical protein
MASMAARICGVVIAHPRPSATARVRALHPTLRGPLTQFYGFNAGRIDHIFRFAPTRFLQSHIAVISQKVLFYDDGRRPSFGSILLQPVRGLS